MPTYSRKTLRQALGVLFIRDTYVGLTEFTFNSLTVGVAFGLNKLADTTLTTQSLYENATVRHVVMPSIDYRVASFNAGSGAVWSAQIAQGTVSYHDEFEIHSRLPATEKDLAIDDTIKRIRVRQEVGFMVTVDNEAFFTIEGVASPHYVSDVLDVYYFANPYGSLTRDKRYFQDVRIVTTASGRELRIKPTIMGSQQIILDAVLELTLGSDSTATLNLPDDRWVLAGAAARCYDLMIQTAPGQNAGELAKRRAEWAGEFTRLSGRFAGPWERKIRLNEVGE